MVKFTTKALISFLSLASLGLSAPSCSQSYVERSADTIAKIKNDIIVISDTLNAWKGSVDNFPTTGGSVNAAFVCFWALLCVISHIKFNLFEGHRHPGTETRDIVGKWYR